MPHLTDKQLSEVIKESQKTPGSTPEKVLSLLREQGFTFGGEEALPSLAVQTEQLTLPEQQPTIPFRGLPPDQGRLTPEGTTLSGLFPELGGFETPAEVSRRARGSLFEIGGEAAETLGQAGFPKIGVAAGVIPTFVGAQLPESGLQLGIEVLTLGGARFVGKAIQLAKTPTARKFIAQLVKATSVVPERTVLEVLKNPKILSGTETTANALKNYVRSLSAGKEKVISASEFIAKRKKVPIPKDADFEKLLGESLEKLRAGTATPQDALNAHQSITRILGSREFRKTADLREILATKEEILNLLDQTFPKFKKANRRVREAYIREEFNSFLPLNKNLSPNALRSLIAMRNVSIGVLALSGGDPRVGATLLAGAIAMSPKAAGLIIKLGSKFGPLGKEVGLGPFGKKINLGGLFTGAKATAAKKTKALIKSERGAVSPFLDPFEEFGPARADAVTRSAMRQIRRDIETKARKLPFRKGDPTAKQAAKFGETLSKIEKARKGLGTQELRRTNEELRDVLARTREALKKR